MAKHDLKKAGLKVTSPRVAILQVLEESDARHLTAEDVYRELRESGQEIGLATVYRVLSQFETAGLVSRHHFEESRSVFERSSDKHHDHMVCVETGAVMEFVSDEIEQIQKEIAASSGFDLVDHSLVLFVRPKKDP